MRMELKMEGPTTRAGRAGRRKKVQSWLCWLIWMTSCDERPTKSGRERTVDKIAHHKDK